MRNAPSHAPGRAPGLSDVGTLAAYFPRDDVEARRGEMVLPGDIGNAHGEMDIGERAHRHRPVAAGERARDEDRRPRAAKPDEENGDAADQRENRHRAARRRELRRTPSASILGDGESPEERRVRAPRQNARRRRTSSISGSGTGERGRRAGTRVGERDRIRRR